MCACLCVSVCTSVHACMYTCATASIKSPHSFGFGHKTRSRRYKAGLAQQRQHDNKLKFLSRSTAWSASCPIPMSRIHLHLIWDNGPCLQGLDSENEGCRRWTGPGLEFSCPVTRSFHCLQTPATRPPRVLTYVACQELSLVVPPT